MTPLPEIFKVQYGDRRYIDKSVLDEGETLLIASQGVDNGAYGFFDVPTKYECPLITVPRTGSIGYAFVQLTPCTPTDDCIVLIPKKKLAKDYLFYVATMVRLSKWRYNYGRKITPERLSKLEVINPEDFKASVSYDDLFKKSYPKTNGTSGKIAQPAKTNDFEITALFNLERGHFHAIDRLESGDYPTVSRTSYDSGLVGFFKKPKKAKVFSAGTLTVSTVTGDAFLQLKPFIATDNVVMCIPKEPLRIATLLYIQAALNQVNWRYSYGRQCYKGNFQKTVIILPVKSTGELDEDYIEAMLSKQPYWQEFSKRLPETIK